MGPAPRAGAGAPRRPAGARGRHRSLGKALLTTAAATLAPGSGHLLLRHRRTGGAILGVFGLTAAAVVVAAMTVSKADLLSGALSSRTLVVGLVGMAVVATAWIAVIVRTYAIARPRGLDPARQALALVVVTGLCLVVAAPFGFAANLANSQRNLLDTLFSGAGGGTAAADAIAKSRLNILLVGSDAGPDRKGTRTDTMMVASLDTRSGRTVLFALPRNIQRAPFPPGSPMSRKFPNGFHDPSDPTSGNYLLNAVYAYGNENPAVAPQGPTGDPGLNLLHQAVATMLGLQLDYYLEVDMAGFASIIDALGGLRVDVGPEPIPIGGITPDGRHVRPDGYIPAGVQQLSGQQALAFARSRTNTSDYVRMGRQRCLLQYILDQKSPANLLTNFQAVASATKNSVATNIPQQVLPALVKLADGQGSVQLESVSFDPSLPDPTEKDGRFSTADPDYAFMRKVVQDSINATPAAPPSATAAAAPPSAGPTTGKAAGRSTAPSPAPAPAGPTSLAGSC